MAGLCPASVEALSEAEAVFGGSRHLGLIPPSATPRATRQAWPVPFSAGVEAVLALRGRRVAVLVSGDPFWFGAGTTLAAHLEAGEWQALPGLSAFSLAAARLGWPLERTVCAGLHAAPFGRLRPHLAPGAKLFVLVRDGAAPGELATWLAGEGFGASTLHVMEALGGPRERLRSCKAAAYQLDDVREPVLVGIEAAGDGPVLPWAAGRGDEWFAHDGQLTKQPIRALALAALGPRPGELLWDIGAGSGSIAIEWLLAHPGTAAIAFEADAVRAERAARNAERLGADRLQVVAGRVPGALEGQPPPDAVFIGGGLSAVLLEELWGRLRPGTRVVAHAVTLESEALLAAWQAEKGGELLRVELADASPLGARRGWKARYPIVQWRGTR